MKAIHLIIISAGLLVSSFIMEAQGAANPTTIRQQPIKKERNQNTTIQPKIPTLIVMYFAYDADKGDCHFTLPADVEYIDIELTNLETQIVCFGSIDSISPIWHQPLTSGEYSIVCTADNGDIYSGYIYI